MTPVPLDAGSAWIKRFDDGDAAMTRLGEVLDPIRKQVIDVKDALAHARYRYDAIDLLLERVSESKLRAASQEIFAVASEKMNAVDDMLDELYRQLSSVDRILENHDASQTRGNDKRS